MRKSNRVGNDRKHTKPVTQPLDLEPATVGIQFVKGQLADYIEAATARTHFDDMLSELEILHELARFHPGLRKEAADLSGALRLRRLLNRLPELFEAA